MKNIKIFILVLFIFNSFLSPLKAQESKWTKCLNYEPFYFTLDREYDEYEIIPRTAKDYGLKGNVLAVESEFITGNQFRGQDNKYKYANAVSFFENGFISSKYLKRKKLNYAPEVVEKTEYVYGNEAIVNGKILSINKKVKEKTSLRLKQEGPEIEFEYRYTNEDGKKSYTNGDLLELMIYVGENLKIQRVFTKEGKLFKERRYHKITTKVGSNGNIIPVKDGKFYLSSITSYSYDDQMRVTRKYTTKQRPNGVGNGYSITNYTYNKIEDKLQVKVINDKSYIGKTETVLTFNSAGNLIFEKVKEFHNRSNRINTYNNKYEYEYDSKGNWIKRTVFYSDSNKTKGEYSKSRKIFYHD